MKFPHTQRFEIANAFANAALSLYIAYCDCVPIQTAATATNINGNDKHTRVHSKARAYTIYRSSLMTVLNRVNQWKSEWRRKKWTERQKGSEQKAKKKWKKKKDEQKKGQQQQPEEKLGTGTILAYTVLRLLKSMKTAHAMLTQAIFHIRFSFNASTAEQYFRVL